MERAGSNGTGEAEVLRNGLRERRSIDHFARAWYAGLLTILLTGIWVKVAHDSHNHPLFLWPGALLCLSVLLLTLGEIRTGGRIFVDERARLARLRELEAAAPPPPELF
jgi:hypothetical protein